MSFKTAEDAIEARIKTLWSFPAIQLFLPGKGFTAPPGPYARFDIVGAEEQIISFGGGKGRNTIGIAGAVVGTFATPLGSDLALARNMRDAFGGLFRYQVFNGITFAGVTPVGGDRYADDGKHFRLGATAEFLYRFQG